MRLTPMRFKDYTWPHNPEIYTVESRRRMAAHPIPGGGYVFQELGENYPVLSGEGVFVGENAYEEFQKLAQVFQEGGPGLLVHPVWPTEMAYFVELKVTEKPLPDYVRYRFTFWGGWTGYSGKLRENNDGGAAVSSNAGSNSGSTEVYTVKKGDTLWGISRKYGVELAKVIAANPGIKNPNLIYPGDKVVIP